MHTFDLIIDSDFVFQPNCLCHSQCLKIYHLTIETLDDNC